MTMSTPKKLNLPPLAMLENPASLTTSSALSALNDPVISQPTSDFRLVHPRYFSFFSIGGRHGRSAMPLQRSYSTSVVFTLVLLSPGHCCLLPQRSSSSDKALP
jgi:hypothetical protein